MSKQTLYHKGKQGELRIWSVWTEGSKIKTEYGVFNGEMQISTKEATPKNIGRSNETTAEQQAILEAQSLYQFKLDRKYSKTQEEAQEPLLLPMLAKDDLNKIKYPCYVQPKLDGVRCLAFWEGDRIKLISRAGKEWTVPKHINEQVAKILPKECMLDGELYIHGKSCQTITSYVKKWREVETPTVKYHIYDMPIYCGADDLTFEKRSEKLEFRMWKLFVHEMDNKVPNLVLVRSIEVNDLETLKGIESAYVKQGYEGAIARNKDGLYTFGYRSNDLIKIKTFQDAEFLVISCRDGVGKFEGCVVFTCKNDLRDNTFECTIKGTMEERAQYFQNQEEYIGEFLTVKFQGRTDDQKPRFPVGKLFRPKEDLK